MAPNLASQATILHTNPTTPMSLLRNPRTTRCLNSIFYSYTETSTLSRLIPIQTRGKKKLPRSTTITIRLLQDVREYGRKGTILAVAPARMRNHLYPRSQAAYMTAVEVKQARAQDLVMERDASFGMIKEVPIQVEAEVKYDMLTITPHRTRELLEATIPPVLEFERTPIAGTTEVVVESKPESMPSITPEAIEESVPPAEALIHGSVSSLDILSEIMTHLTQKSKEDGFADAARVVLSAHDVEIRTGASNVNASEGDKIKALGEFQIAINLKAQHPVVRKVRVVPVQQV